jgi:hypothetical protein
MPAPTTIRIPRLDARFDVELREMWDSAMRAIETELTALRSPAGSKYTTSNATGSRALNVSTATASQTADVLATLLTDMAAKGQVAK